MRSGSAHARAPSDLGLAGPDLVALVDRVASRLGKLLPTGATECLAGAGPKGLPYYAIDALGPGLAAQVQTLLRASFDWHPRASLGDIAVQLPDFAYVTAVSPGGKSSDSIPKTRPEGVIHEVSVVRGTFGATSDGNKPRCSRARPVCMSTTL